MHNIAIIGCGPAGLSAALFLHRLGYKVSVFERFETAQPVGSGLMLQPTGLHVLEQLELRAAAEHFGQRIDSMLGRVAPNGKVVLDVRYQALEEGLYGVAIHRAALFHVLHQHALEHKIPIITAHTITDIKLRNEGVCLETQDGEQLPELFDFVVDASGRQLNLLKYADSAPKHRHRAYGALWATVPLVAEGFHPHRFFQFATSLGSGLMGQPVKKITR